jgi:predicted RNase H-like HicB family nuclease
MQQAIEMHLQGLKEDRQPIPKPQSSVEYITVEG